MGREHTVARQTLSLNKETSSYLRCYISTFATSNIPFQFPTELANSRLFDHTSFSTIHRCSVYLVFRFQPQERRVVQSTNTLYTPCDMNIFETSIVFGDIGWMYVVFTWQRGRASYVFLPMPGRQLHGNIYHRRETSKK